jgi:hypothetical protein
VVKLDQAGVCQDGAVFHNDNAVRIRSSRDVKGLVIARLLNKAGKDSVGVLVSLSSGFLHVHRHERRTCLCNLLCQCSEHTVSTPTRATRRCSTRLGPQLEILFKTTTTQFRVPRPGCRARAAACHLAGGAQAHNSEGVEGVRGASACEPARRASQRLL